MLFVGHCFIVNLYHNGSCLHLNPIDDFSVSIA